MNYDKLLLSTLSQDAYYLVNKELVRKLGVIPSLTLSLLIDKYKYFKKENKLDSQGGFFLSAKKTKKQINIIERELKIARSARRTAFDVLKKNNLAKIIKKGNPAQYHYYLNFKSILGILSSEDELTPLSQDEVNPSSEVESSPLYNKNKEQKQINNAEKLTSSKFIEYKNRLRSIDEKFNLSYLESSKANQYYEQAQKKYEELNSNKSFSEFFESILVKLEKLTSQKLDRFAFKQGFTIESLVKFDLQGCAKVEAWYNDCYPQSHKTIIQQVRPEKQAPTKFSNTDLDSLKEFLA